MGKCLRAGNRKTGTGQHTVPLGKHETLTPEAETSNVAFIHLQATPLAPREAQEETPGLCTTVLVHQG